MDPLAKLRLVTESNNFSSAQAQDASPFTGTEPLVNKYEQSFQRFKFIISTTNLMQSLCQDVGAYNEIKGLIELLSNFSKFEHKGNLLRFLAGFEPIFENIAKTFQQKKDLLEEADKQYRFRQKELDQSDLMKAEAFCLEATTRQEEAQLANLMTNIPLWEDEIRKLQ